MGSSGWSGSWNECKGSPMPDPSPDTPSVAMATCPDCKGQGWYVHRFGPDDNVEQLPCETCGGTGDVPDTPSVCPRCASPDPGKPWRQVGFGKTEPCQHPFHDNAPSACPACGGTGWLPPEAWEGVASRCPAAGAQAAGSSSPDRRC